MSTIKLTCLFRENLPEDAFEIEVEKYETVRYLKKILSEKIPKKFTESEHIDLEDFLSINPMFLNLWKVNIPISEKMKFEQLKTHTLSIKEILCGVKMTNTNIDYYFSNDTLLCKNFIHIIVELPIGIGK
jgi:hypothetical protein